MNKLIFCTQEVNKANIRRENRGGVEHIIITSFTLPPDIVMNGVLYPKDVTHRDYKTFNRTPATIEHPMVNDSYVSANDPEADMDFRIGAFNENAELAEDGRVKLDKVINVKKAMMSDKGKRLLDRIEEIEVSADARPMHTSVGVWTEETVFDEPQSEFNGIKTNAAFHSVVTSIIGDHDAFLLDSSGAATPSQGTGIGINSEKLNVEEFFINNESSDVKESIDLRVNQELSFDQIRDGIYKALKLKLKGVEDIYPWIAEIYDDYFIYELENILYRASYEVDDNGNVSVQDDKQEVVLKKEYVTKEQSTINPTNIEGTDMISKADLISMLTSASIAVNADISEEDLKIKLNALLAKKEDGDSLAVNKQLTDTVTSLTEKLGNVEAQLKDNADTAINAKIATIKACSKYSALPEAALTFMANNDAEAFATMHADSIPSVSIGNTNLQNNDQSTDDSMFEVNVGDTQ